MILFSENAKRQGIENITQIMWPSEYISNLTEASAKFLLLCTFRSEFNLQFLNLYIYLFIYLLTCLFIYSFIIIIYLFIYLCYLFIYYIN